MKTSSGDGEPEREVAEITGELESCARVLDGIGRPRGPGWGGGQHVANRASDRITGVHGRLRSRYRRAVGVGALYEMLTDGLPHRRGEISVLVEEHRPLLARLLATGRRVAFTGARRWCGGTLACELRSLARWILHVESREVDLYYELAQGDPFGVVD